MDNLFSVCQKCVYIAPSYMKLQIYGSFFYSLTNRVAGVNFAQMLYLFSSTATPLKRIISRVVVTETIKHKGK